MNIYKVRQIHLVLILILSVFFIAGCGGQGHWLPSSNAIAPTVSSTVAANAATGVPIGNKLTATFSEVMDSATITTATFSLAQGVTPVAGAVTYTGVTAVFTPAANLAANTLFTATITTGAKNLAGNALASNYVWTFTTGAAPDTTAPTVSSTIPVNAATAVAINSAMTATFSEAMDPLTITAATFTLAQGVTPVAGTVTYTGVTATFTPAANLAASTLYTATITTGAKDLAGNALVVNKVWSFTTGALPDTTAPTVSSTIPVNAATGVAINSAMTATFSEAMAPLTITATTFTLAQGITPVAGVVTYAGVTATFTPAANLAFSTVYTATITTGAKDLAGNALAVNRVWTFTTGAAPDTTAPTVSSTIPVNAATGVAINSAMTAVFSEAMAPLTITTATFTLAQGITPVAGAVTYAGVTATFTPAANLAVSTVYTATITTGAKDLAGNALAVNKVWSFTTGAAPDITAPTVILVNPADLATGVAINSAVHATFSEAMNPLTISTANFKVAGVIGLVTYNAITKIATFTPATDLAVNTTYTATITTGVADLAGNTMAVDKVWSFTTAAAPIVLPVVNLRTVAPFGTFGGTAGMTNQGIGTVINGDIGTIATTTSTVTGFHDTEGDIFTETGSNIGAVNGTIYTCTNSITGPNSTGVNAAYCALATQARLDAETAYLFLATMPSTGVLAGNLAGTTINPGVYTNASSVLIQGGDLTLDALGDANAVFVFQIGSTLTLGGPGAAFPQSIILAGGAQAKNVFWQVGTFATINAGGGGTMVGTIITQAGVSFSTVGNVALVTLNGRALSLGASVTMVNTVVNVPEP